MMWRGDIDTMALVTVIPLGATIGAMPWGPSRVGLVALVVGVLVAWQGVRLRWPAA